MRARVALIRQHRELQVLEAPEHKRRWEANHWDTAANEAMRIWIERQVEVVLRAGPLTVWTAEQLAVAVQKMPKGRAITEVLAGRTGEAPGSLAQEAIVDAAVPFLACLRFSESGLAKHDAWEQTWELQHREDAGEQVDIPVPPKYKPNDFRSPTYWRHRGKLDVPKERFISYPGAESDNDPSPLIGWAGWDHLQQATALSTLYQQRKNEDGWGIDRLTPLLAGLWEFVPWLKQWHNEPSDEYGGLKLGDFYDTFVKDELRSFNITLDNLKAWRPARTTLKKKKKPSSKRELTPEALLGAVARLQDGQDGVTQKDLAEDLGVSSAAVGKVAGRLVESSTLIEISARPRRFAMAERK